MKMLTSFDQLASELAEAEQKQAISDDAFRQAVSSWYISTAVWGKAPPDPYSPEYKAFQLAIYESLAGKPYSVANEETVFNFDHELLWPYPYGTQSAQTVGTNLLGYGWLIKSLNLPPKARILEIGSGYGSLTVHLARMGYQVTCLDVSAALLAFIQARTKGWPEPVKTICGDMAAVDIDETFDAVIFNASLHHSLAHRSVIERLDTWLTPQGIVAFMAEPVVDDQSLQVPYPWGVRLDGLSVWSICKWGWLELGFRESYFVKMLNAAGWKLIRHNLGISGQTDVWLASRAGARAAAPAPGVVPSGGAGYDVDLETEVVRLRNLVAAYENGRFMRLMKWLKGHTSGK